MKKKNNNIKGKEKRLPKLGNGAHLHPKATKESYDLAMVPLVPISNKKLNK
jgi:hypothetical protein